MNPFGRFPNSNGEAIDPHIWTTERSYGFLDPAEADGTTGITAAGFATGDACGGAAGGGGGGSTLEGEM